MWVAFPPVVVSSSGCSRRGWLESEGVVVGVGWRGVSALPPTLVSSSGCSRRMWLESEGMGLCTTSKLSTEGPFGRYLVGGGNDYG